MSDATSSLALAENLFPGEGASKPLPFANKLRPWLPPEFYAYMRPTSAFDGG